MGGAYKSCLVQATSQLDSNMCREKKRDCGYVRALTDRRASRFNVNAAMSSSTPLLPKRCDSLLDSEADSDVTFLVGSELCRVPGHRSVLAAANPVFKRMFEGPISCEAAVRVTDVDRRGFSNLLRYLYKEQVLLQSVPTALRTLYAAHKYQCHGLELTCLDYLSQHVDLSCVLDVYSDIRNYCESFGGSSMCPWAPSAPPHPDDERDEEDVDLRGLVAGYSGLRQLCLEFIDAHADQVLEQEQMEDMIQEELLSLVERDTFGVSSELRLFVALERWATCHCQCRRLELSPDNLRDALGPDLLYSVRYLLMTPKDFLSGPMRSRLLSRDDGVYLLDFIVGGGVDVAPAPKHLEEFQGRMRTPRIITHDTTRGSQSRRNSTPKKKKPKKEKKPKTKDDSEGFSFYFLSCLSCILD